LEHYDTSRIVWDIETELHKKFNEKTHNPTIKFGGYTECFDICILQDAYNEALVILEGLTKLQLA